MPQEKHPYGTTLLSRDKPVNREKWGDAGIGYIDVLPSVCTNDGECPYYTYLDDATRPTILQTPIHLLIASFRDQLCPRTLYNIFAKAENPNRIYVRVIEQTKADSELIDDAGCWDRYCSDYNTDCQMYKQNVRTVHVDASKAKGPTDARSKLSAMIHWDYKHRDDALELDFQPVQLHDFCMQTDSHMDFSDHWDTLLIEMFHRTENDYAVLSTYVADISQNNQDVKVVPNLCMVTFTSTIRNWGTKECIKLKKPKLTNAMWGAGLSFHRCHAELNVPVDPYLDQVFDGEEGSRGIRFFTHGYDVYTPDRVLVTHDYHTHQGNPIVHTWGGKLRDTVQRDVWKFTEQIEEARSDLTTFGTERVNALLGIGDAHWASKELDKIRGGRFGLGTKRTLEQAIEFTGIDLRNRKMVKNKCGNLEWVPFQESPNYGVDETLRRGLAVGHLEDIPDNVELADDGFRKNTLDTAAKRKMQAEERPDSSLNLPTAIGILFALTGLFLVSRRKRKNDWHME